MSILVLKEMTVTESREIRKANACEASSHDNSYMEQCLRQFMEVCGDGRLSEKVTTGQRNVGRVR